MRVILKRILIISGALIFILLILLHGFSSKMRGPIGEWPDEIKKDIQVLEVEFDDQTTMRLIQHDRLKKDSVAHVIFIHGAPGAWDAFEEYLLDTLIASKAVLSVLDRPGYGNSNYGAFHSTEEQVGAIRQIVLSRLSSNVILVGHSYGAPIAAAYQMKYHDANALIQLGPVVDPENEKIFWFTYPMHWRLTSWLFPKWIQVSTEEKFIHAEELESIKNGWTDISIPVHYVYDEEDWIAPGKENLNFIKRSVQKSQLSLHHRPGKGHLIPWNDKNYVDSLIFSVFD